MKFLGTINIPSLAGDLPSPVNGDMWYNAITNKFRKREAGVTSDLDTTGSGGGGGLVPSINNISANQTLGATTLTDYVYFCTGGITVTMPTATGNTNPYTINNSGTTTMYVIYSGTTFPLTPDSTLNLRSNGTVWRIV